MFFNVLFYFILFPYTFACRHRFAIGIENTIYIYTSFHIKTQNRKRSSGKKMPGVYKKKLLAAICLMFNCYSVMSCTLTQYFLCFLFFILFFFSCFFVSRIENVFFSRLSFFKYIETLHNHQH